MNFNAIHQCLNLHIGGFSRVMAGKDFIKVDIVIKDNILPVFGRKVGAVILYKDTLLNVFVVPTIAFFECEGLTDTLVNVETVFEVL